MEEEALFVWQEAKREKEEKQGFQYPLQGHDPSDLTSLQ
jgi:hypothetical protein